MDASGRVFHVRLAGRLSKRQKGSVGDLFLFLQINTMRVEYSRRHLGSINHRIPCLTARWVETSCYLVRKGTKLLAGFMRFVMTNQVRE